jgi:hypothetical protein
MPGKALVLRWMLEAWDGGGAGTRIEERSKVDNRIREPLNRSFVFSGYSVTRASSSDAES